MWQIMTGFRPAQPPEAIQLTFSPAGTKITIWTYGGLVLDDRLYGQHDYRLRAIIAWCMGKYHPAEILGWPTLS